MTSKSQVTLTFGGDAGKLQKAAARAGEALTEFGGNARRASRDLDSIGEKAGDIDTRMMGFRDGITGVQDTMGGWSKLMEGDIQGGLFDLGAGIGDLASSVENLGVHLLKNAGTMAKTAAANVANVARSTAAMVANVARQIASWALLGVQSLIHAAKVAAAWLISIGPLVLIGIAVAALVYLIIKHWDTIKKVIAKAAGWIWDKMKAMGSNIKSAVSTALSAVKGIFDRYVAIYRGIFEKIVSGAKTVFRGLKGAIVNPFKGAARGVKNAWNSLLGGKGFSVPDWVPGIGGKSFKIPRLAQGGIIMPRPGGTPFVGGEGGQAEAVIPLDRLGGMMRSQGGGSRLVLASDGSRLMDLLLEVLRESIDVQGGDVQVVLGSA